MIAAALFTVACCAGASASQQKKGDAPPAFETIAWLTDLEAAKQQSSKTNKPLFVVFRCER